MVSGRQTHVCGLAPQHASRSRRSYVYNAHTRPGGSEEIYIVLQAIGGTNIGYIPLEHQDHLLRRYISKQTPGELKRHSKKKARHERTRQTHGSDLHDQYAPGLNDEPVSIYMEVRQK